MINRSKMRRQLYRGGGITRQRYGLGDLVRKLIPNELADVAVKAAPFVAPFYPGAAALMRGIGRYDQRGSLSDALKQGAATYGLGKGIGYLGGAAPTGEGFLGGQTYSKAGFREGPIGRAWDRMMPERQVVNKPVGKIDSTVAKQLMTTDAAYSGNQGLVKNIWKTWQGMSPGMQTAIVGVGSGALAGVAQWFENQIPQEPGESMEAYMARRSAIVGDLMLQYMNNTRAFDAEWTGKTLEQKKEEIARLNKNQGGRVGLKHGTPEMGIKSLEAGAPDITYEGDMRMASAVTGGEERDIAGEMWMRLDKQTQSDYGSFENYFKSGDWIEAVKQIDPGMSRGPVIPSPEDPINPFAPKPTGPVLPDKMMAAKGGRIGYRMGMGPAGLPGIPRQAPDGMEYDMRMNGGFQGLGAKEGKDDVPAMLAKNEFVFTADAVRGAGGGDIELGAQRMYDTMKNLEKRVV